MPYTFSGVFVHGVPHCLGNSAFRESDSLQLLTEFRQFLTLDILQIHGVRVRLNTPESAGRNFLHDAGTTGRNENLSLCSNADIAPVPMLKTFHAFVILSDILSDVFECFALVVLHVPVEIAVFVTPSVPTFATVTA